MQLSPTGANAPRSALLALFMALIALTPLLHVTILRNPDLARYPLLGAMAGLGLLVFALEVIRGTRVVQWHGLLTLISAYYAWAMLSTLWTQDPGNSLIEATQLSGLVLIAILAAQIGNEKNTQLLLAIATAGAAIAALLGIWQNYGYNPFGLRDSWIMGSTFFSKNHAAMYFDFIVPAAFILVLIAATHKNQWLAALGLALCTAYVLSVRTRGSWLGLSAAVIVLVLAAWKVLPQGWLWARVKERCVPLICAALFSITVFSMPGQISMFWDRSATAGHMLDNSTLQRLSFYYNALPMIADRPLLGTGLGSFRQAFRSYMHSNTDIIGNNEDIYLDRLHSDPLQFFVELGMIGGILAWAIYFMALRVGTKVVSTAREQPLGLLALALTLGLVANGVHALIDFPYHKPASAIHFWLSLGLLAGLPGSGGIARVANPRKLYSAVAIALAVSFLVYNTVFYSRYLRDNYYALRAETSMQAGHCSDAMRDIDYASQAFGLYWATHAIRTQVYAACERDSARLLKVMNEELQHEPTNARALLTRGDLYRVQGLPDLARADYLRVTELFPKRGSAFLGLAQLAVAEQRDDDALALLAVAITNEPQHIDALTLRTELRRKHGMPLTL